MCLLPEVESLLQTRFALPHQIVEPIMSLVDCLPCSVRQIRLGHTRPLREEWVAPCRQRALPAPSAVLHRSRRASQKVAAPGGLQALQALRPARAARPARLPSTARSPTNFYAYQADPADFFQHRRRPSRQMRIEPLDCQFWNRAKIEGLYSRVPAMKGSTRRDLRATSFDRLQNENRPWPRGEVASWGRCNQS